MTRNELIDAKARETVPVCPSPVGLLQVSGHQPNSLSSGRVRFQKMLNSTAPTTLKNLSRTPNHQDTKGLPDCINYICLPLELCHSASEESSPHLLAITIYVSSASENGCQLGGYAGGAGAGGPLLFPTFEAKTCVQLDSFKALSEYRITRMKNRVNVNGHPGTGWHPQIMPFKWGSWGLLVWAPKAPRERWTWLTFQRKTPLPPAENQGTCAPGVDLWP